MKNLFSVLTEEQLNSLSKEERDALYAIDKKLFPDDGNDETGLHNRTKLNEYIKKRGEQELEEAKYTEELEKRFV